MKTNRLVLRRFTVEDAGDLFRLNADPEVMRWLNGGEVTPMSVITERILPHYLREYTKPPHVGHLVAESREAGEFLGWFSLVPAETGHATLGYRLKRSAWGRGLATEGARALINLGFSDLGLERVSADTYEKNIGSRRVMEKCGMRLVRTYHMTSDELDAYAVSHVVGSEVWDADDVEYAITLDEWQTSAAPVLR